MPRQLFLPLTPDAQSAPQAQPADLAGLLPGVKADMRRAAGGPEGEGRKALPDSINEIPTATRARSSMSDWYALLAHAVNRSSQADVAAELGVSRTSVSLLLAGKYPGGTERMEARITERLGRRDCPLEHGQARRISTAACEEKQNEAMPTSSPAALRRWRQCQHCKHHNHHRGQ